MIEPAVVILLGMTGAAAECIVASGPAWAGCAGWTIGNFSVQQNNGLRVDVTNFGSASASAQLFLSDGAAAQVNEGKPVQHGSHNGSSFSNDQEGPVTGRISGSNIEFTVRWNTEPEVDNTYRGNIADNGQGATGITTNTQGAQNSWMTAARFICPAQPAPANNAPPAKTGPTFAPQAPQTATVTGGPLPVYNIAHNDIKDPTNGVQGLKIATLPNGTVVTFDGEPCKSGWCRIKSPLIPHGFGFAQEQFLML